MDIGFPELLIVLVLVLLLFGSSRLPKLSRSIGESLRELRGGLSGTDPAPEENNKGKVKAKAPEKTQTET